MKCPSFKLKDSIFKKKNYFLPPIDDDAPAVVFKFATISLSTTFKYDLAAAISCMI